MSRSLTVEIEKMVYGGRGMGRVNGKVVFVPFTAPGEKVQVEEEAPYPDQWGIFLSS
ncbi:MAG: TRAM domain-containing protein [Proteobacteria bacterium]|nr:TRAM domain-containing protein [Pseudomonadota bacterium]